MIPALSSHLQKSQQFSRYFSRAFSSSAFSFRITSPRTFSTTQNMAAVTSTDGGIIASKRRDLHPPIEPYNTGFFEAGDGYHTVYYEASAPFDAP